VYKGLRLNCGYRVDLLIEKQLIIELKAVTKLLPVHEAQILTYMKLTNVSIGLLINFNEKILKNGLSVLFYEFLRDLCALRGFHLFINF